MAGLVISISCRKSDTEQPEAITQDIRENTYPASFNWSTTQEVNIEISGLTALPDIRQVLIIESPNGNVYLKKVIYINENFLSTINMPATENEVVIKCGKIESRLPVTNKKVVFSLNTGNPDD